MLGFSTFSLFNKFGRFFNRSVEAVKTRTPRIRSTDIRLDSTRKPYTLRKLRIESIRLFETNSLARALNEILLNNVIGTGLKLSISNLSSVEGLKVNPEDLEKKIMKRWQIWSKNTRSDYTEVTDFLDLQSQAYLGKLLQGEIFSIQRYTKNRGFNIQLIEAHRTNYSGVGGGFVNTENLQGIEYGQYGQELKFTFDDIAHIDVKTADGRKQVIHLFRQTRPGQMRGVPYISPAMDDLKNLDKYTEYEIKAAIISASFTSFITSEKSDPVGRGPLSTKAKKQLPDYDEDRDYAMAPGAMFALDPGESIKELNPTRPNQNFKTFFDTIVRDLSAACGVPFEILVKMFNTSYTAARAAVLEFWKTVMFEREHFARRFCQEIFEQWLFFEVLNNKIIIPGYLGNEDMRDEILNSTRWVGSAQPQIDEVKAANAAKIRLSNGTTTREVETKNINNGDFFQNAEQLEKEADKLSFMEKTGLVNV